MRRSLASSFTVAVTALLTCAACGSPSSPKAPESAAAPAASTPPPPPAPASTALLGPAPGTPTPAPASAPSSAAAKATPSKISARHVLIQWMGCEHTSPSVVRTRDQARAVAEEVLKRAKAGEDFGKLAVEFSDEPNAGQRGGSLGRFGHGMMVKPFEDAAFALEPGGISPIIETGFGFHVIQRTE